MTDSTDSARPLGPWQAFPRADLAPTPQDDARVAALLEALGKGVEAIDDLNTLEPDENGHRWRKSDLLDQEVMALRHALAAFDKGGKDD